MRIAARVARDRARVVDVGKCHIDLPWNDYYEKELDVRFSRSYGPGRYDETYELDGIDYPAGYVRWTERRNLACFVDLLERGALDLDRIHSDTVPFARAPRRRTKRSEPVPATTSDCSSSTRRPPRATTEVPRARTPSRLQLPRRRVRCMGPAPCGSGSSARAITRRRRCCRCSRDDEHVELACVATNRSLSALDAQRKFGFADTTTSVDRVLDDESIAAVFVVTRHHSHADLACRALERGKAVFVEKPLALSDDELDRVLAAAEGSPGAMLMVGFNRRFSPLFVELRDRFAGRSEPGHAHYLVSAGRLDRVELVRQRRPRRITVRRRRRPLPRHARLVVRCRAGRSPRGAGPRARRRARDGAIRRRLDRIDLVPHRRQRPRAEGDVRGIGGRALGASRELPARDRVEPPPQAHEPVVPRHRQGPARRAARVRRRGAHAEPVADPACLPRRDHPRDARRRAKPRLRTTGAGVTAGDLRWYVRRASRMSPTETAVRVARLRPPPGVAHPPGASGRGHRTRRRAGAASVPDPARSRGAARPARRRVRRGRRRGRAVAHRRVRGARCAPRRPARPRLVPRSGHRPARARRPLRVPDPLPLRSRHRQRQADLGGLAPPAPHGARDRVLPDRRPALRGSGREPAALMVAAQPVPLRRALDERHRDRAPAHRVGLDPAAARRLGRRARAVRRQRRRAAPARVAPGIPRRVPERRLVGEQSRDRGSRRSARRELRDAVVRGAASSGAPTPRISSRARPARTPFRAGCTASSRPTTTCSSRSCSCSPRSRASAARCRSTRRCGRPSAA